MAGVICGMPATSGRLPRAAQTTYIPGGRRRRGVWSFYDIVMLHEVQVKKLIIELPTQEMSAVLH